MAADLTSEDRTRASELLSDFLGENNVPESIYPEDIITTTDISECEPFVNLIKQITGESKTRVGTLPFTKYSKVSPSKLDHVFKISTIHKDLNSAVPEVRKFEDFYRFTQLIEDKFSNIARAAKKYEYESITEVKAWEVFSAMADEMQEIIDLLKKEKIPGYKELKKLESRMRSLSVSANELYKLSPESLEVEAGDLIYPLSTKLNEEEPTSYKSFGYERKYKGGGSYIHRGIDLSVTHVEQTYSDGTKYFTSTDYVLAVADGMVTEVTPVESRQATTVDYDLYTKSGRRSDGTRIVDGNGGYGNVVKIMHNIHGDILSVYAHLESIEDDIYPGAIVKAGQTIGVAGATGNAQGPHLHFEIRKPLANANAKKRWPVTNAIDPWPLITNSISVNYDGGVRIVANDTETAPDGEGRLLLNEYNEIIDELTLPPSTSSAEESTGSILPSVLGKINSSIMSRVTSSTYTSYVNDISGKAEGITIDWAPGTSVSIPMEGQPAPVVQSMGGRNVQVNIRIKETDPINVAKIALMFKVGGKEDTLVGMMTLARSALNGSYGMRNKFIHRWYRAERIENILEGIAASPNTVNLDEPVAVENDFLNGLGLDTFHPMSMEVRTIPEVSEGYEILLTLSYMNLGNRTLETLKKNKSNISSSILPVTTRVASESGDTASSYGLDNDYTVYQTLTRLSIVHCLAELLPIYIMSRVYRTYKALEDKIEEEDGIPEVNFDSSQFFMSTLLPRQKAKNLKQVREVLAAGRKEGENGATFFRAVSSILGDEVAGSVFAMAVDSASRGVKATGSAGPGSKWTAAISGLASTGLSMIRGILSLGGVPDDDAIGSMYINIPSISPLAMWSLLQEFVAYMAINKESEFILDMAKDVISLVNESTPGDGERMFKLSSPVNIRDRTGKLKSITELHVSMLLSGSHDKKTIDVVVAKAELEKGLGKIAFSTEKAQKLRQQLLGPSGGMQDKRATGEAGYGIVTIYGALTVNWLVIDALKLMEGMISPMNTGGDDSYVGEFFKSAADIISNGAIREHCEEVLTSIITSSLGDVLASGLLEFHGRKAMYSYSRGASLYASIAAERGDLDETELLVLINESNNISNDIIKARRVIQSRNISYQLLSGVLADRSFAGSSELRKGYCHVLGTVLSGMQTAASGASVPFLEDYLPFYKDYTIPNMMEIIDRPSWEIIGEEVAVAVATMTTFVLEVLIRQAGEMAAAWLGGFIGAAIKVIAWVLSIGVFVWSVFSTIIDAIFDESVELVFGRGNLLSLSRWAAGRIVESMDSSQLIECCLLSGVWIPAALNPVEDASDTRETSYRDFPTVLANGKPLPPDFYVYKVGLVTQAYEQLKGLMNDAMETVRDRYSDLTTDDVDSMRSALLESIGEADQKTISDVNEGLTIAMTRTIPSTDKEQAEYFKALGQLGDIIDFAVYGDETKAQKYGGVCFTIHGHYKSSVPEHKCMVRMNITTRGITVLRGVAFSKLSASDPISQALANRGEIIERAMSAAVRSSHASVRSAVKSFLQIAVRELLEFIAVSKTIRSQFIRNIKSMPDTLGNLFILKGLVGSNMKAVGKPGLALFRNQLEKIGHDSLRRSAALQSQYIFPTVKLYFIEEDEEHFYLFDDLYSYASIVSLSVNMDKNSPQQVAEIQVTNLFGNLNNVLVDSLNRELNFFKAPDENAPINAIMLRPGCKVKIQVGSTPLLTEEDTVFTGRISTVNFDVVTSITAVSHGDMFLEDISKDVVKVYGNVEATTGDVVRRSVSNNVRNGIRSMMADNYMTPINKLKGVISYVLNDLVQSSERLTDFSIRPPIEIQDPELTATTTNLMSAIKDYIIKDKASGFLELIGAPGIQVHANQQLFENIRVHDDLAGNTFAGNISFMNEGYWVSRDESSWDVLREINLLLPNHNLLVRPYDTRSTLVWTEKEGYYKFKRSVEKSNMLTNAAVVKLQQIENSPKFRIVQIAERIKQALDSTSEYKRAGALAMLTHVAYVSQRIYGSFMTDANVSYRTEVPEEDLVLMSSESGESSDMIDKALRWIPIDLMYNSDVLSSDLVEIYEDIADENDEEEFAKNGLSELNIDDISMSCESVERHGPSYISNDTAQVVYLLSLNLAADSVINFMSDLLLSRSKNHRKTSDVHVKVSGRDIVKNDIQLMEPYNAVRMTFPKEDAEDPEELAATAIIGADTGANELLVPLHYKLKPWSYKIYQTHFKNANAFRMARSQAIATASSSILANLMSSTYGGNIVLLGDSKIKEGDRIVLWDENKDMFGTIGVKSHTLVMSPQEGCLSIIEPEMITRNDGKLQTHWFDQATAIWNMAIDTVITATVTIGSIYLLKRFKNRMAMRSTARLKSLKILTNYMHGISESLKNLRQATPMGRVFSNTFSQWFNNLGNGVPAKELYKAQIRLADQLDIAFGERTSVNRYISSIKRLADTLSRNKATLGEDAAKAGKILSRQIGNRRYNKIIKEASDYITKEIVVAKHIGTSSSSLNVPDAYAKKLSSLLRSHLAEEHGLLMDERKWAEVAKSLIDDITGDIALSVGDRIIGGLNMGVRKSRALINARRKDIMTLINEIPTTQFPRTTGYIPMPSVTSMNNRTIIKKATEAMMDGSRDVCLFNSGSILKWIKNNPGKAIASITGIAAASAVTQLAKEIGEMYFLTLFTADKITLAPLMFRGEPFVAGLEGVTKKDGEEAGIWDIMVARLGTTVEALRHIKDPLEEAVFELVKEKEEAERNIKGIVLEE